MTSEIYFQNPEMTRKALARYARLVGGKGEKSWSIAESKLGLYRHAATAFTGTASESTRRSSHGILFGHLRSWWGLGRNGTLWDASTAFDVQINECEPCFRRNGLTLTSLEDKSNQQAVVECLENMRGVKQLRSGSYPIMALSKNLHFYNPRLFAIYDNDIVLKKVYRIFRADWNSCYRGIVVNSDDEGIAFYLAYLLWGGQMIREAYASFMDDFADWFIEAVRIGGDRAEDFRDELRLSLATAFEFVVIGAAHLERTSKSCRRW
jgi:hypothetical protein